MCTPIDALVGTTAKPKVWLLKSDGRRGTLSPSDGVATVPEGVCSSQQEGLNSDSRHQPVPRASLGLSSKE